MSGYINSLSLSKIRALKIYVWSKPPFKNYSAQPMSFLWLLLARNQRFTYLSTMSGFKSRKSHLQVWSKSSTSTTHIFSPSIGAGHQRVNDHARCLDSNCSTYRSMIWFKPLPKLPWTHPMSSAPLLRFWAPKSCRIKCNVWPQNSALETPCLVQNITINRKMTSDPFSPRLESH